MAGNRVPLTLPQKNIHVDVNGQPMNVVVVESAPHNIKGVTAKVGYTVDERGSLDSLAFQSAKRKKHFMGVLTGTPPIRDVFAQLIDSTDAALRLVANSDSHSAIITASSLLSKKLEIDNSFLVTAILLGVRKFADWLNDESDAPAPISEIVLAAGAGVYDLWSKEKNVGLYGIFGERPENEVGGIAIPLTSEIIALGADKMKPNELQQRWLETIGAFLVDVGKSLGFHRNSPPAPTLPNQRHLTVKFGTITGLPIEVTDRVSAFELAEEMPEGTAAIDMEYIEIGGRSTLLVGKNIVANSEGPIDQKILEGIQGIRHFMPILPEADNEIVELGDGQQIIELDEGLMKTNAGFARRVVQMGFDQKVTTLSDATVSMGGMRALSTWWSRRTEGYSSDDLVDMMVRRVWGYKIFDFSVSKSGTFVGVILRKDLAHNPRGGTERTMGTTEYVAGVASDITFRQYKAADGKTYDVPTNYNWHGEGGIPQQAFLSWYNLPLFRQARSEMVLDDELTEVMFRGMGPLDRLFALAGHLRGNPKHVKKLKAKYDSVTNAPGSYGVEFDKFAAGLDKIISGQKEITDVAEIKIAMLEMFLRMAIGDRKVNKILSSYKPPKKPSGSGTPPPPPPVASGGGSGGKVPPPLPQQSKGAKGFAGTTVSPKAKPTPPALPGIAPNDSRTAGAANVGASLVQSANAFLTPPIPAGI